MKNARLPLALMLSACLAPPGAAEEDPHANCARMGWVPREILERPVPLRPGTGNSTDKVTTASAEAQAFYVQGMNYLHGYVWIEAARSFHQALRHDPGLALARVGLSRVYSGLDDPAQAEKALAQAEALVASASPREKRRVAVRRAQLTALADLQDPAKHAAYKKALDDALAVDIDDAELWLLRGNAEEATAAGRGQRGGTASTAFYQQALRLEPENAAAHHYLVHSYETIAQIPRALDHGEAYARLSPAIPHAHHMWGHDLRRVGRIDDAIAAFERTNEMENAYYAAEKIAPELDWHHVHNLDLLATSYQHKGRMKKAEATMRAASALAPTTDYLEFQQKLLPVFLLGRGRLDEAAREASRLSGGKWAGTRAVAYALLGQVEAARGRMEEAREALASADRELESLPTAAGGIGVNRGQARPWVDVLRGELLLREGRQEEGRAALQEVAKTLRALPGPDAWIQALFRLESLARLAREAGDWDLADFMARQMLEHDAAYAGSHMAAALVAERRGDGPAAARARGEAERYWRDADPDLPELAAVRRASIAR